MIGCLARKTYFSESPGPQRSAAQKSKWASAHAVAATAEYPGHRPCGRIEGADPGRQPIWRTVDGRMQTSQPDWPA